MSLRSLKSPPDSLKPMNAPAKATRPEIAERMQADAAADAAAVDSSASLPSSGLKIRRISSSSAARPVAASMMSGQGSEPALHRARDEQERDDAGGDDEEPRDGPGEEEVEDVDAAADAPNRRALDSRPVEEAEDEEADVPPPIFNQSDVLNLLRSTCASR